MKDADKSQAQLILEIAQLRQQVQSLQTASKTFQAILNKAPIQISAKDLQGTVLLANERCNMVKNICHKQLIGSNLFDLLEEDKADHIWQADMLAISTNNLVESEETMIHTDDSEHQYFSVRFPLSDDNQEIFGVGTLSYDINQTKYSLGLSIADELTKLYSRRYFNMRFEGEHYRSQRGKSLFTLYLIDIDEFDSYQKHYGKQRTDEVLTTVAGTIQNVCSRSNDLSFRLSDSQMACLLSVSDYKDAKDIAEDIRSFIASLSIEHPHSKSQGVLTVSIGIAIVHYDDELNKNQICKITQEALNKAQAHGGNHICLADKSTLLSQ
jgi:diguanylate cyclase (GGDEF)-like protein